MERVNVDGRQQRMHHGLAVQKKLPHSPLPLVALSLLVFRVEWGALPGNFDNGVDGPHVSCDSYMPEQAGALVANEGGTKAHFS